MTGRALSSVCCLPSVCRLPSVGQISGTLVGFATQPAIIGTVLAGGHEPVDMDVDGTHFSATGVAAGDYVLVADTFGHEADTKRITVRAGKVTQVTLTSRGTTTLTGTVTDWQTRQPVANARCGAPIAIDGDNVGAVYNVVDEEVMTDGLGKYRRDGASAGEVLVQCTTGTAKGIRFGTTSRDRASVLDIPLVRTDLPEGTIDASLTSISHRFDQIVKGGDADVAGIVIGDVVTAVDGRSITELYGDLVMTLITQHQTGTPAAITIVHGTATRIVNVVVRAPDR